MYMLRAISGHVTAGANVVVLTDACRTPAVDLEVDRTGLSWQYECSKYESDWQCMTSIVDGTVSKSCTLPEFI